jgi:SAM-dependent methyltransferase
MDHLISIVRSIHRRLKRDYGSLYSGRTRYVLTNIRAEKNILILGARESFIRRIVDYTGGSLLYFLVDKQPPSQGNKNLKYLDCDLNTEIPLEDDFFDCVVADQIIEHLYQPDLFLEEIHRVVKYNGTVIIGSENLASWHNILALAFTLHPFSDHYSTQVRIGNPFSLHHKEPIADPLMRHVKVPTIRALKELMEYHDFRILKVKGFGHLLPWGTSYDKYHSIHFVVVSQPRERNQCLSTPLETKKAATTLT